MTLSCPILPALLAPVTKSWRLCPGLLTQARTQEGQQEPGREAPGWGLTITGQWCPLTGVEGGLAAPQIFFALGHQKRVTHVTVMEVLQKQPLGEGAGYQGTEIFLKELVAVVRGDQRPEKMVVIIGGQRSREHQ